VVKKQLRFLLFTADDADFADRSLEFAPGLWIGNLRIAGFPTGLWISNQFALIRAHLRHPRSKNS
jgi:hypothetical protein